MRYPNFNLYPPCGYSYPDPESGLEFSGGNWPEVVAKLTAYRQANGIAVGDPDEEIFGWYCRKFPKYCEDSKVKRQFVRLARSAAGFASAMQAWIADTFSKVNSRKIGYVSGTTLHERVAICTRCPKQKRWTLGCAGCEKSLMKIVGRMLRGTDSEGRDLAACAVLREETSVSVHLDLKPVEDPRLPAKCWRRAK